MLIVNKRNSLSLSQAAENVWSTGVPGQDPGYYRGDCRSVIEFTVVTGF